MNTFDEMRAYFDEKFGSLDKRFDRLETRIDDVEGRMGRLEGRMGGVEGKVDDLQSRMDGLEEKIDDLAESAKFGFASMVTKDELRATEARLSQRIVGSERRLGGMLHELVDVLGEKQVLSQIEIDRV